MFHKFGDVGFELLADVLGVGVGGVLVDGDFDFDVEEAQGKTFGSFDDEVDKIFFGNSIPKIQ